MNAGVRICGKLPAFVNCAPLTNYKNVNMFTMYGLSQQPRPIYGDRPAALTVFVHVRPTGNVPGRQ